MAVDNERIMQKVAFIKEQINDIENLVFSKNQKEILEDKFLVKGLKYSLQTAIEAMIDIVYHLAAKQFNHAPEDARDAFYVLKKNGIINKEEYNLFCAMVGFRNRMVHLYQDVSDERVYEFSVSELKDFDTFIERIRDV